MGDLLIRNVSEDVRALLKARALKHGRSQSDEAKAMLESAVKEVEATSEKPFVSVWDAMAEIREKFRFTEEEHKEWEEILEKARKAPDRQVPDFEW